MREIAHEVSGFVKEMEFLRAAFDGAGFGAMRPKGHPIGGDDLDHAAA